MKQEPESRHDEYYEVQDAVATLNTSTAAAVRQATLLAEPTYPSKHLSKTHDALLDVMQETREALTLVERTTDQMDETYRGPTPRQITSEHADRIKERYEGPVRNLALMLVDRNRREWLHEKPGTVGAKQVERHGLTENQRRWLGQLSDAWREYDGE